MNIPPNRRRRCPRGGKSASTDKQTRKAEHIEEGYRQRGSPEERTEAVAWATASKEGGGGNRSGFGRGVPDTRVSARRGGRLGGKASDERWAAERSGSAGKAAAKRKRNADGERVLPRSTDIERVSRLPLTDQTIRTARAS